MLIDNPDAFKSWLTSVLEPLCDADPEALAKYVYALVKKDKSVEALRQCMIEQLDVFLQAETKPFVELLFKTLETQEYIVPLIPNANPPNPNVGVTIKKEVPTSKTQDLIVKDIKPIIPVSTLPNLSESVNGNVVIKKEETSPVKRDRDHRKSDSEKEERTRTGRRHRSSSRNRSRSRSWDRGKRSRSRDRSRERSRERIVDRERRDRSRPWRNKSPPRRYDRRRSRSGSPPGGRVRSRSRSPKHSYRDRSRADKDKKDSKLEIKDSKDENSGGATPTQDSNHGDTDMRLANSTQSIQSVVSVLVNPAEVRATGQLVTGPAQPTPGFTGKRRCRDFDEKGYCMRGEMCPYDHGIDPVVLEDTALTRVLTFGPQGPNGAPGVEGPPVPPLLPPPMVPGAPMIHPHIAARPQHPVDFSEYNPSAPQMWHRPGFRGPRPMMAPRMGPQMAPFAPLPSMQRELISVPVTDNQNFKRRHDYQHEGSPEVPIKKKGGFDFNRLGPRSKNPVNCSLELKKVPRGLNNITHLNNHFSKFGKIVNIQVNFEGDPEGALITFSSHAEANAAYRSTEAVLNNRFIKVFWHSANNEGKQENVPPRTVKDRLGQPVTTPNSNKVLNLLQPKTDQQTVENQENVENIEKTPAVNDGAAKTTVYVPTKKEQPTSQDSKALANAAILKGQEILAAKEQLKKKHEEKRKEAIKITQDLRKRKQELLEKQLAQQKLLIEKLEKTNPTGQQRELLMSTIKTVQESIESIRKELMVPATPAMTPPKPPITRKSKEEAQKEVLDAELDLITRQQEGGDTSELQKRLLELKAQAHILGAHTLGSRRARGGRRGRYLPAGLMRINTSLLTKNNLVDNNKNSFSRGGHVRGRGGFQKHTVDHRPTKLLVSGYEADESDSVLAHFAQYGEITDYVSDDSTPSIILNYKTRKEAEVALLKGKNFQDRTLSVTWSNNAQLNNQRGPTRTVHLSENTEDQLLEQTLLEVEDDPLASADLSETTLLQDDEEEDDENEDRSWRR